MGAGNQNLRHLPKMNGHAKAKAPVASLAKLLAATAALLVVIPFHAMARNTDESQSPLHVYLEDLERQKAAKNHQHPGNLPRNVDPAASDDDLPVIPNSPSSPYDNNTAASVKHKPARANVDDDMPVITPAPSNAPQPGNARVVKTRQSAPPNADMPVIDAQPPAQPVAPNPVTTSTASLDSAKGKPVRRLRDVIPDAAAPTAVAPAPTTVATDTAVADPPVAPAVRGPKRLVVSPTEPPVVSAPPAKAQLTTQPDPQITAQPPVAPAVPAPQVTAATVPTAAQPVPAPAAATDQQLCAGTVSPGTGVAKTVKFGTEIQQTLAAATVDDPEEHEYIDAFPNYQQEMARKPIPATPAAAQPKSAFVQNLLKYAKLEAARVCRETSKGTKCRPGSKAMCLQGVRMAFQRAAGESTGNGWTLEAKNAGPYLKKYGYHKAQVSDAKTAPPGSVFIYVKPGTPSYAGHIEIKGTDGYYSDFYSTAPINTRLNRKLVEVWVPN